MVDLLRKYLAVRDAECLVRAVVAAPADRIGEVKSVREFLAAHDELGVHETRLAHAELGRGVGGVHLLPSRGVPHLEDLLPVLAALRDLDAREVAHGKPVARRHRAAAPLRVRVALVAAERELCRGVLWRVDCVHVRPAEDRRYRSRHLVVAAAGLEEHVRIAGAVDNFLCEDRLASFLRLEHHALHAVAGLDHVDSPAVEEHLDIVLGDHLVHHVLGALGVDCRKPVLLRTSVLGLAGESRAELAHPVHELLAHAARHQRPLAVVAPRCREHYEHHAVGEQAAKRSVALDERDLRACLRGCNGGGKASRAAAHHNDVGRVENWQLVRGLDHLAVLEPAARAVLHRVLEREDVLAEPDVLGIAYAALGKHFLGLDKLVAKRRTCSCGRTAKSDLLEKLTLRQIHFPSPAWNFCLLSIPKTPPVVTGNQVCTRSKRLKPA